MSSRESELERPLTREDEIWHLKRLNFFPAITEEELNAMLKTTVSRRFDKGAVIYLPGEEASHVYLVREGYIRVSRTTPEGRSLTLDILNPGDIFGEMALAGQDRRSEVAEAMQDCTLWAVPRAVLQTVVEQNPQMALEITKIIGFRRLQIENKVSSLLCTVPARLARLLLTLVERYPGRTNKGHRYVKLRLTHQDMGDLIAANREIVTVMLNRFKKDGLIAYLRYQIVLQDERSLHELAGIDKSAL